MTMDVIYPEMLQNSIEPTLIKNLEITFQLDGASQHYYCVVRLYISNRLIGI